METYNTRSGQRLCQDTSNRPNALSILVVVFSLVAVGGTHWAQGNVSSLVNQAIKAHGNGWQNGAVKNWAASGTVTLYRYDAQGRQLQQTFPMTLLHAAAAGGGGSKGNQLQRLIFKAPPAPPSGQPPSTVDLYSSTAIQMKEGTDGRLPWYSVGALTAPAAGRSQQFIEAHTVRSIEALLNSLKQGKNLTEVTAAIPGNPGNGRGNANGQDRAHVMPAFEAAQNKHVIDMSDSAGGEGKSPTRFYIDNATSLVTRMEFDFGSGRDPFSGRTRALTEIYEFSDYRDVPIATPTPFGKPAAVGSATVKFPFMIERYLRGQKVETMVLNQVLMNVSLSPENFTR